MDELVDLLDPEGNPTGKTVMKSEAHRKGLFHPTVHIWLYTRNGEVLLQQRAPQKDTHPLLWDVSVAGHVGAGETIPDAAVREVEEEIGLTVGTVALEKVGVFRSVQKHHASLIDCEYHHTFLCELKVPLPKLVKQEGEVADLALIPLIRFSEEIWGLAHPAKYVPHGTEYYQAVIRAVKNKL